MIKYFTELFTVNGKIKIYSLILSLCLWFVVLGQKEYTVTKEVSVEYVLGKNYLLDGEPNKVSLVLKARRKLFRKLETEQISVLFDLRGLSAGFKRYKIEKRNISLPVGVKMVKSEPAYIDFILNQKAAEE